MHDPYPLGPGVKSDGQCDGSISFPSTIGPTIMWTPDCDEGTIRPPHGNSSGRLGFDRPRAGVAFPRNKSDPLLLDFVMEPTLVDFGDSPPAADPGQVWKSDRGDYMNMIAEYENDTSCALARYTSTDPKLLKWRLADPNFATIDSGGGTSYSSGGSTAAAGETMHAGERARVGSGPYSKGCKSAEIAPSASAVSASGAPMFYPLPGSPGLPGGPTHVIDAENGGEAWAVGTYDPHRGKKKPRLLPCICQFHATLKMPSFYQDRLGTNILNNDDRMYDSSGHREDDCPQWQPVRGASRPALPIGCENGSKVSASFSRTSG
jgi:hypothetical protein